MKWRIVNKQIYKSSLWFIGVVVPLFYGVYGRAKMGILRGLFVSPILGRNGENNYIEKQEKQKV